ncbi:hypothetical protein WA026_017773 [Henosepilachna vigintioctopunctata]|uniref:Cationic amino acid transporter C-terminal domain-containing protein n=1 Tax=Henosepilachna vigintioctopunctata TaxID=420089 RepID=A0AAW1U4H1_9CUCU
MRTLWKVLTRRKVLTPDTTQETPLARVLNTFDLTALGVGSTLGVGVYVLAGQVAKNVAGPAVVISFLIAAIASVFAGLCYAEFGARAPRAGSAYIYSYLCVGEFVAFVIGWNLILEYIIGSASVAKGMSSYIDNLWNGTLSRTFLEIAPINLPYLSSYFDFFAFVVPVLLSVALAFGMKESSLVNNIFTTLNICVVLFVIIAGSLNAHLSNWFIDPNDVKNVTNGTDIGSGGFFPFGIAGVIKGAATCFYGFVGFDCIATTAEEVKNPKKAIPIAIVLSLAIIFLSYFGTSTVVTLMVPYYEQDPTAPIPFAFQSIHWYTAALIVSIGAIFGLYASLFGAMFPLPRILYAMASDGLIFRCLGQVNDRFRTPIFGTLFAGLFTGLMAALFNLQSLVNMMSIGTLLAYTIVAASVLLLRYSDAPANIEPINDSDDTALTEDEVKLGLILTIFNYGKYNIPNKKTELIVSIDICIYCILCFLLGLCGLHLNQEIMNGEILPITAVSVILLLMALTMLSILSQPLSKQNLSFQVPWVPLIPALSILFNIYLMVMLDIATWIRFVVWMILGIVVFHFSGRNICKKHKTISTDLSRQDLNNQNFYEEGHNVEHENFDESHFEPNSIYYADKQISDYKGLPHNNDDSKILTPSKVIESLDLVLDSFIAEPISPDVMSIENVSYVSNVALVEANHQKNCEYRDTQNIVLHAKLLKALNVDDRVINIENTNAESIKSSEQIHDGLTEKNFDVDNRYRVNLESYHQ